MSQFPTNEKPHGSNHGANIEKGSQSYMNAVAELYGTPKRSTTLPNNWRDRLPDPATYYGQQVQKLGRPNATGWAQGTCPFHEDRNKSLSVSLTGERGGWRCFAGCGGGDLAGFHQRLTGKAFKDAVLELIGGAR